jgi:hypothetical protein
MTKRKMGSSQWLSELFLFCGWFSCVDLTDSSMGTYLCDIVGYVLTGLETFFELGTVVDRKREKKAKL